MYLDGLPVAMFSDKTPDEVLQIHNDHLGTPRAVTSASNEILWRMEGDQFGDVQPQVSLVTMPLRHAGQYADSETGLFYNYFRFYDPKTGRYVTSDPIGLQGGMNTYGYVGANPTALVDPYGLFDSSMGIGANVPSPYYSIGFGFDLEVIEKECCDSSQDRIIKKRFISIQAGPSVGLAGKAGFGVGVSIPNGPKPTCDSIVPSWWKANLGIFSFSADGVDVGMQLGLSARWNLLRKYWLLDEYTTEKSCCS